MPVDDSMRVTYTHRQYQKDKSKDNTNYLLPSLRHKNSPWLIEIYFNNVMIDFILSFKQSQVSNTASELVFPTHGASLLLYDPVLDAGRVE